MHLHKYDNTYGGVIDCTCCVIYSNLSEMLSEARFDKQLIYLAAAAAFYDKCCTCVVNGPVCFVW